MAAYGCLRSLITLLDSCSSLKSTKLLPQLEEILYPLMAKLISNEVRFCLQRDRDCARAQVDGRDEVFLADPGSIGRLDRVCRRGLPKPIDQRPRSIDRSN